MTAVVLAAISAIALYFLLLRIAMERVAWMLTVVFALGTGTWSTASQALWSHTFGLPAMIGCFYAIERFRARDAGARWYWSAGVFAALALAIRPINASLLAALAAGLIANKAGKTDYIRAFTPPAVAAVALALYNLAIFHSLAGGYSVVASGFAVRSVPEFLRGVAGLLISPGRGLFVYTPVAMFALFAWLPRARTLREEHRPVFTAATTFVCAHIAVVAIWPMWWGGYCWGSRLLTELLPAVIVLIALGWPAMNIRWKRVFAAAAVYDCFIQALGVYFYPKGRWDHLPVSVNDAPARLWDWGDNPIVRTARGGVAWEPYAIAATAAAEGLPAAARKLRQLGINAY